MKTTSFLLLAATALRAATPTDVNGFAPVSVSAANYRATPRTELVRAVEGTPSAINPEAPELRPLTTPQHYIFMRGEVLDSDLAYEQVTELLAPALARKGYVNAADAKGAIREPGKVTLVLRISYGENLWRLPTVRTEHLTWHDGMVPRPRGRSLTTLGGERMWDQRAGGDDGAFEAIATNQAAGSIGLGSAGGGRAPGGGGSGEAPSLDLGNRTGGNHDYGATREFHLIVVDAFDYRELRTQGLETNRLWSTFVAAPKQRGQKFSDLAATLIRNATPYFGETSTGLQVYSDTRAEVKIGEIIEVRDAGQK